MPGEIFGPTKTYLKSNLRISVKTKIFNQCVVPSLTYGVQTWATTATIRESSKISYFRMLRSILNIRIKDKISLGTILVKSGARDID